MDLDVLEPKHAARSEARVDRRVKATSAASRPADAAIASFNFTQKRPGNRSAPANVFANASRRALSGIGNYYSTKTQRLAKSPSPFQKPELVPTTPTSGSVAQRVLKVWGYSVFPGPTWELCEDLAYFKELKHDPEKGQRKRPIVHAAVPLTERDVKILDETSAAPYLPYSPKSEESIRNPGSIDCSFGPFEKQREKTLKPLEAYRLSDVFPRSTAIVMNAGGAVWGLDWCPVEDVVLQARNFSQYLAVGAFPTGYTHIISSRSARPMPASIQIWCYRPASENLDPAADSTGLVLPEVHASCPLTLCVDCGPALELKWCPLPCHGVGPRPPAKSLSKLGILAGVFADGTVSVFAVPDPEALRRPKGMDKETSPFVRLQNPLLRIELEDAVCTCLDWGNSEVLAVGCSNGNVVVYDIREALINPARAQDLLPTYVIEVAQCHVKSVAWVRAPPSGDDGEPLYDADPASFCATSYDGSLTVTDVRDSTTSTIFRARDVPYTVTSGPWSEGAVAVEHENQLKSYTLFNTLLGKGHNISESKGPVWHTSLSNFHPHVATASADGTCMTTNGLKPLRRGSAVPLLLHKIYQMDYNRNTGKYRMMENFIPQKDLDRLNNKRSNNSPYADLDDAMKKEARTRDGSGSWPAEVGIHRVAWHNGGGYGCVGLLASGTASGLVRIDWLEGRWLYGKITYGSVKVARQEAGGEEDDDAAAAASDDNEGIDEDVEQPSPKRKKAAAGVTATQEKGKPKSKAKEKGKKKTQAKSSANDGDKDLVEGADPMELDDDS
ncbi:hypothetical protein DL93DRAFT_2056052 [Clavulina sp. PMI_390]|nr:hypothetical protein DL93DRAFT_2056052 [Clavulina sp. PMI_390]